jgi:hypothetical protein
MAIATPCQTSGAVFHTSVADNKVSVQIDIPFNLDLTEQEAALLEANIHNAMELVLAPHFK